MKVKRIILSMISALVLTAIFMGQTVLAYEPGSWTFMEICVGSSGISVNNPEYAIISTEEGSGRYSTLTQIGDSVGSRKINMYCGKANVGFESRTQYRDSQDPQKYMDDYKQKYNMSNESISSLNLYDTATTNKILALADLMYLGADETVSSTSTDNELDKYLRTLWSYRDTPAQELPNRPLHLASYIDMNYDRVKNEDVLLTANQIRAVQQAAIWYFTNNFDHTSIDEANPFLYQRTTTGDYTELSDLNEYQNTLSIQLYKYLINKAEANANNSSFTNTVYLYVDNSASGGDEEQAILEIVPGSKVFDLALRKFITKIGNTEITNRVPAISGQELEEQDTTASKVHPKDALPVSIGDKVIYKIRIYNEGEVNGYASEVTDYLPAGLTFVPKAQSTINTTYDWNTDGQKITTTYLADKLLIATNGDYSKFKEQDANGKYYRDLEIECFVNNNATSNNLRNIAEITNNKDENGNDIQDIDSTPENVSDDYEPQNPTNGLGEEDDDDFENLRLKEFDLALRKYIAKVGTKTYEEDGARKPDYDTSRLNKYLLGDINKDNKVNNEDIKLIRGYMMRTIVLTDEEMELADVNGDGTVNALDVSILKQISNGRNNSKTAYRYTTAIYNHQKYPIEVETGDVVTYKLVIYNEGEVDGRATTVIDQLPAGVQLQTTGSITSTKGNTYTISYDQTNNKVTFTTTGTTDLAAYAGGETLDYDVLEFDCKVTATSSENNSRIFTNIAWIAAHKTGDGTYTYEDRDSNRDETTPTIPENLVTTDAGYINEDKNSGKDWARKDQYFEGQEDDDDFEKIKLIEFDLALRKYITKVEDKDGNIVKSSEDLAGRNPNMDNKIDTSKIPDTADYKHQKDPVVVKPGYFVYYNLTVYNEGDIAGFAKTITDQLPTGVKFVEVADTSNSKYQEKSYDETTNVLILERKENQGVISAYNGTTLNSETVTIKCEVTADTKTGGDKIYTNIAWISEDYNEKGVADRDSKPVEHPEEDELVTDYPDVGYINETDNKDKNLKDSNEYFKGEQDDDDFEKIIIYKEPEIHKGVKDVKNQDSGYDEDVNTPHEWVINSSLPVNVSNYQKYEIVDDIDYRLVYGKVTSVNIIDKDGKTVARLEEGKDYVLDYKENTSSTVSSILGTKYSGTLTLTFIDTDKTISDTLKANGGNIIEVKFNTTFAKDENGKLLSEIIGKEIPNKARLEYKNAAGEEGKPETEKPEVHTGGITLYKYKTVNNEKVALEGAEFEIFRSEADAKTRANEVKEKDQKSSVKALQTAKSGKDGLVEFVGLEYGEDAMDDEKNKQADGTYDHDSSKMSTKYWIVETVAPKGYATITEPIEVSINNDTYKDEVAVLIREEESKETTNRLIENKPLNFDLSLRKFITDVNDKAVNPSREPVVDTTNLKEGTSTTATYNHPKDPVDVVNNDVVSYTLRIFNEGQINGYASIITDDIPDGLEFLPEHDINKEYRWVMYEELKDGTKVEDESKVVELNINGSSEVKKYVETNDAKKAVIVRTDYLSREQNAEANLINAFDGEKLDYKDVKLAFRVIEPNGSKRILINYAQISEDKDEDGNEVEDIDSTPDKWNEGEDDQDIEKLRVPEFDLALRKWVTQAIVTENGKSTVTNTGHDAWDDPEAIVKVELHRRKLSNVTVKFRYSIRVYNQGELEGYAKEITDYIPAGLKFIAADNPDWKDEGNNIISTRKLENTLLKPGEFADVEVLLTWINGNDNLGLKVNTAEISEDYNEKGVPDKDSTPDNKKPGEDDIDDAPVMLSVSTGMEATYIILGTSILLILAGGIFLIKKYVL